LTYISNSDPSAGRFHTLEQFQAEPIFRPRFHIHGPLWLTSFGLRSMARLPWRNFAVLLLCAAVGSIGDDAVDLEDEVQHLSLIQAPMER